MEKNIKKGIILSVTLSSLLVAPTVLADVVNTTDTTNSIVTTSNANAIAPQSYADKTYGSYGDTTSVPVTDTTKKAVTDGDGQITSIHETNGYVSHTTTTVEKDVPLEDYPDDDCTGTKTTTKYTDEVDLNAKSVMDTNLDDYSNNGYLEKVKNPNNHPNAYTNLTATTTNAGPANLEVQHWQNGTNNATKSQYWRVVFGSDYAINNAVMTVTLPYSDVTTSNATDWLVDRYYNAVTNSNNIYTNKLNPISIEIINNIATITFGDIPAGSAYAIVFTKLFNTPQDFSNNLKMTSAHISGTWKSDDLTGESKYINSSKTAPTITWSDQVCLLPEKPTKPSKPTEPTNPSTPEQPILPSTPTSSKIQKNGITPTSLHTVNTNSVNKEKTTSLPTTGDSKVEISSLIGFVLAVLGGQFILKRNKDTK
ncbi:hypothetical protein ASN88_00459 [Streptococcus parauberis]|uniref:LPXTG cell wall anchor domain-containing protein n=1 Tax=Streptococcus parauberis TaxID=1348 RepID=UPI000CCE797C|nr:LPXTG cell wall anchor domain-containing protein [Streptococcus parauberis]PNY22465.1 hypothetical protein ASN88_00459 [Streptococcus parauberis]